MTLERKREYVIPKGHSLFFSPKPNSNPIKNLCSSRHYDDLEMLSDGTLAILSEDKPIEIWDIERSKKMKEYETKNNKDTCFIRDSIGVVVCEPDDNKNHYLLDLANEYRICDVSADLAKGISNFLLSPSRKILIGGKPYDDKGVYIWQLPQKEITAASCQSLSVRDCINAMTFQTDDILFLGLQNGDIEKYVKKEKEFKWEGTWQGSLNSERAQQVNELIAVKDRLLCYKEEIDLLQLIDLDLKRVAEITAPVELSSFAVCKNGTVVAISQDSNSIFFYNFPDLKLIERKLRHKNSALQKLSSGEIAVLSGDDVCIEETSESTVKKFHLALRTIETLPQVGVVKNLVPIILDYCGFGFFGSKNKSTNDLNSQPQRRKSI